jgi:hypothetical protein
MTQIELTYRLEGVDYTVQVIRQLQDYEVPPDQGEPMYEVRLDAANNNEQWWAPQSALSYPAYELPDWQAQPLTLPQWLKLADLCRRYRVSFDPAHYRTWALDAVMTKGFAEGWVGGPDQAGKTIMVGVEPNGDSHS